MPNLEFQTIWAKKFHSIGDIRLDIVPGKHLVIGEDLQTGSSNGSGKSSIFESLIWTAFKRSIRGTDPSTNGQGNCETGIELLIDKVPYQVERKHKMSRGGSGIQLLADGEDISARNSTDVDSQIETLFGMPYELMISTCVVLQGLPVNFSQFTPSLRKGIFESILGFSIWDNYKARVDKQAKAVVINMNEVQGQYTAAEREMVDLNARVETLESTNKDQAESIKAKMKAVKVKIADANGRLEKIQVEKPQSPQEVLEKRKDADRKYAQARQRHEQLEEMLSGNCPICGSIIKPDGATISEHEELSRVLPELETVALALQDEYERVGKVFHEHTGRMNVVRAEINALRSEFQGLTGELTDISSDEDAAPLKARLEELNAEVNTLNGRINELEKQKSHFDFLSQTLLPSSQFRTKVLADYIAVVSDIMATISPLVFPHIKTRLVVDKKSTGIDIEIVKCDKPMEYKQLSGGEKRRLDVVIILSIQKFLLEASGIKTNLLVFDEIFDSLDSSGVESVLNAIDALFDPNIAVYIISHNNGLKSRFDNIVHVMKDGGVSRLA